MKRAHVLTVSNKKDVHKFFGPPYRDTREGDEMVIKMLEPDGKKLLKLYRVKIVKMY